MIPAIIIGYVYRMLAIGYLNTGRDLRRMESNTRSPIFANFGELLEGIVTVRAFSAEQRFLDNHNAGIDLTTKVCILLSYATVVLIVITDVVHVLDDKPLASVAFRRPWSTSCLRHDTFRFVWLCRCRIGRCLYHFRYGLHDERVLGVSILDGAGIGSQVCNIHMRDTRFCSILTNL